MIGKALSAYYNNALIFSANDTMISGASSWAHLSTASPESGGIASDLQVNNFKGGGFSGSGGGMGLPAIVFAAEADRLNTRGKG